MDGLPVTLIVKAPNQQIEDQTIKCKLTWTIQELKGHLAEVYPCKPKKEEQKLIYSGQLLTDSVMLKDVLRRYEGQDTHTVHLVCSVPQNRSRNTSSAKNSGGVSQNSTNANSTMDSNQPTVNTNQGSRSNNDSNTSRESADGLRRRNVVEPNSTPGNSDTTTNNTQDTNVPQMNFPFINHGNYWNNLNQNQNDPWRSTVPQWGQYNAYMTNLINAPPMPMNNDPMAFAAAQMAWMQQIQAQYMQFYSQMMQNGGTNAIGFQPYLTNQQIPPQIAEQPANNENPEAVAPVNNNNRGGNPEELENWDWLDWFYMGSRIFIMFAVIYFYSSPARFVLVLVTGFLIYLYQIRYFHALIQNNNAENANNNNQQPANVNNNNNTEQQQQQNNAAEEAPEENAENQQQENATTANQNVAVQENQPSYLALTWTVITSFLSSLLPETPNAI